MRNLKFIYSKIFFFLICLYHSSSALALTHQHFYDACYNSIHAITVSPHEHTIVPIRASGEKVKRQTVATLACENGAIAAINGGFWKLNGDPAGALKIDNQWLGTPLKPRGAIGWSEAEQKPLIDRIMTNYSLSDLPACEDISVIPLSELTHSATEMWNAFSHIVGGTPVLIQKGNIITDFTPEQTLTSFIANTHPRSAIGLKENGDWLFVVVDGTGFSGGMDMHQLAQLMFDLGCVDALNLDGGGSSTMVIDGEVINNPCGKTMENGKYVEQVSDAILIF